MGDIDKTKKQLISELEEARRWVVELEALEIERKQAEEALQVSARQWQSTFDAIGDVVCLLDTEHRILRCNTTMTNLLGKPFSEINGRTCWELMHGTSGPIEGCPIVRMRETGRRETLILPVGDRKLEVSVDPLLGGDGSSIGAVHIIADITERKRAEDALKSSERRLEEAQRVGSMGDWEFDIETQQISWSGEAYKLFERDPAQGPPSYEENMAYYSPEDSIKLQEHVRRAIEYGEEFDNDYHLVLPSGKSVYHRGVIRILKDQKGMVMKLYGTVQDITERKQAEEALREAEAKYRAIFEQAAESIVLVDAETGELVEFNERAHESLGYSLEEFAKLKIPDLEVVESVEEVAKHIQKIVKEGSDVFETQHRTNKGEIRDIQVSSRTISIGGRNFVQSIWRDITERKQAEELFRTLSNSSPIGIYITQDRKFQYVNPQFERYVSRSKDELLGTDSSVHIHPADREMVRANAIAMLKGKQTQPYEYRVITTAGDIRYIMETVASIEYQGRRAILGNYMDITERKRAEEALRESEELHRLTLSNVSDAVLITDNEGEFTYICPNIDNIFGYNISEVQSSGNITKLLGDDLFDRNELETLGEIRNIEREVVDKTGREHSLLVNVKRVSIKGGTVLYTCRDITERRRAEEALRESEENFRLIAENSNDGLAISYMYPKDTALRTYVNRKLQELTGYSENELVNLPILTIIHPSERDRLADMRKRRLAGEPAPQHYDTILLTNDGKSIPAEITASSTIWQGQPAIMVVYHDITERKRAEEALRESEERYRALLELGGTVGEAIVMLQDTEQGNAIHVFVSDEWPRMTGYSRKELLGMSFFDLLHSKDREASLERHRRKIRGEIIPGLFEMSIIRKDGTEVPIELTSAYTTYKGERANVAFIRDITERKQAEEKLKESEERFRIASQIASDVVYERDLQTGIATFYSDIDTPLGYEPGGYPRTMEGWREHLHPEDLAWFDSQSMDQLEPGVSYSFEYRMRKKDGTYMTWLDQIMVIWDEKTGKPLKFIGAATDITERKRAEEREKELQQELGLASRLAAVGELAAGIAHEINNPLTGILGFSERLLRKSTDGKAKQGLELIHNEAQRAARVVQNLLTFARRCGPAKEYSDVNDILQSALELRAYELETSNIEVVTDLAPSLPGIMVDYNQIEEVFLNIILNAEQVMTEADRGGKLTIKTQQMKDYVRTSFADDGPGIPAEEIGKVFDPFFTTRQERGGTGLGLSVCHGIVTDHGGRIYARSKPGKGATFFVELPCP